MKGIEEVMRAGPVIPVLVVEDVAIARPLAEILVAGGLPALEVTLRTPAALDAIREMKRVSGAIVGAGTVTGPERLADALGAGAQFVVSPGLTETLASAVADCDVPWLPGVATAGDVMRGLDLGLTRFKFFPAEAAGGRGALAALSAPFAECRFCPTGGITQMTAPDWLAMRSVLCVGGSWMCADDLDDVRVRVAAMRPLIAGHAERGGYTR